MLAGSARREDTLYEGVVKVVPRRLMIVESDPGDT